MLMMDKLDQIEKRLQSLIEGGIAHFFTEGDLQNQLAHQLVVAMQSSLSTGNLGSISAPNLYLIRVHPSRNDFWQKNRVLVDDLGRFIHQAGLEAGLSFKSPPVIRLETDPELSPLEFRISASMLNEPLGETASISPSALIDADDITRIPLNAFLIVNGERNFPLTMPVVNIGRRSENHLVIDDPRVSRSHAQLRAIRGRYVLFDLGSTGGTLINGQRVNQHSLSPGDVISLAGVPLIYGQDLSSNTADTNTVYLNPVPKTDQQKINDRLKKTGS